MNAGPPVAVVILGAGRNVRGAIPPAMAPAGPRRRVLDWILSAFAGLPAPQIRFVGGYRADRVREEYPDIPFVYNPRWEETGPAASLALAPIPAGTTHYVCYSDIVFRPESVRRLEEAGGDLVLAVDSCWRVRYERRNRAEIDASEKVLLEDGLLRDIGSRVPTAAAAAEFAGLLRVSPAGSLLLREALRSRELPPRAGLPDLIRLLLQRGLRAQVVDVAGEWAELNAPQDLARFVLGTKAESLERLQPMVRLSRIGDLVLFSHAEWCRDRAAVLGRIRSTFAGQPVIVRSSALREDGWTRSAAGSFRSVHDVQGQDEAALARAVEDVFASYGETSAADQVFVQSMLRQVAVAGVVLTRTPAFGAPYTVVNFDDVSRRTDSVTSGSGRHLRTVFLHRGAALAPRLAGTLGPLMNAVREIEDLVGHDSLDLEFAVTEDRVVHLLQVRPIALAPAGFPLDDATVAEGLRDAGRLFAGLPASSPFLLGRSGSLSVMTDWNPAEMIGTKPRPLALSLYRRLITDEVWAAQRAEYGYRDVRPCPLLIDILGHPYIDVRASFNSFVPSALPDPLAERLVDHYLEVLRGRPELHDKVEFEVLFTCLTFDFRQRSERLARGGFREEEIAQLETALRGITREAPRRTEARLAQIPRLRDRFDRIRRQACPPLDRAYLYLEDVRTLGTPIFADLARSAFVAVALLRSLQAVGTTDPARTEAFLASIHTVTAELREDAGRVSGGSLAWEAFVAKYGHLRPGSYDITSPRYASTPETYLRPMIPPHPPAPEVARPSPWDVPLRRRIEATLGASGLPGDATAFDRFLRQAIEGRERSKDAFTRHLSEALESLAEFGESHGLTREEISYIRIDDLLALRSAGARGVAARLRDLAARGREAYSLTQALCLPGQIFSADDFECFEPLQGEPNFVTRRSIRAPVAVLSGTGGQDRDLAGRIVVVASADPGFDWIFTRRIAGLVTLYGGANSHMAIRAAEFQLPAAIGVGDVVFQEVSSAELLELDCGSRTLRVIR